MLGNGRSEIILVWTRKGRYTDPDYVGMQWLWRTVKHEEVYLRLNSNGREASWSKRLLPLPRRPALYQG